LEVTGAGEHGFDVDDRRAVDGFDGADGKPRASWRLATFVHTIRSTKETAARRTPRGRRVAPTRLSESDWLWSWKRAAST